MMLRLPRDFAQVVWLRVSRTGRPKLPGLCLMSVRKRAWSTNAYSRVPVGNPRVGDPFLLKAYLRNENWYNRAISASQNFRRSSFSSSQRWRKGFGIQAVPRLAGRPQGGALRLLHCSRATALWRPRNLSIALAPTPNSLPIYSCQLLRVALMVGGASKKTVSCRDQLSRALPRVT
jgi:hypothetical protein